MTIGAAAGILVAIAVLLVAGSGNMFDTFNPVPDGPWGKNMAERFWGGDGLLYHPNSLGLIAVIVAVRVGGDPAFAAWQRVGSVAVAAAEDVRRRRRPAGRHGAGAREASAC